MPIQPPDQLSVALMWISALFMAVKAGIEAWPAALQRVPQVTDWGWLSFVPLFLLAFAAILQFRTVRQSPKSEEPDPDWESKLAIVASKKFSNTDVPIDGFAYIGCTFANVTFVYNGGPFKFEHNNVGVHTIKTDDPRITRYTHILIAFGHISSAIDTDLGTITLPEWDVRYGNKRNPA